MRILRTLGRPLGLRLAGRRDARDEVGDMMPAPGTDHLFAHRASVTGQASISVIGDKTRNVSRTCHTPLTCSDGVGDACYRFSRFVAHTRSIGTGRGNAQDAAHTQMRVTRVTRHGRQP
jgi:hypothetical protein